MFGIREKLAKRRKYINTVRELNSLSDKELFDIGIYRCDIKEIAKGSL